MPTEWHAKVQTDCGARGKAEMTSGKLGDLQNLTVPDARRAHLQPLASAVDQGANGLQIDIPAALGDVVSVADTITELGPAAAYIANLCHKTEIS